MTLRRDPGEAEDSRYHRSVDTKTNGAGKDGQRSSVTSDEIVTAALAVINSDGFAALSMRRLAGELGVFPASLYWHVGNRSQLLALVCERVLRQIDLPPDDLPWKDWLFVFGVRTREVFGTHPRFAAYFVTNIQTSASSLTIAEKILAVLDRAGFQGNDLLRTYNAVLGAIFGWISGEFAANPEEDGASARAAIEKPVLPEDTDYPHIRRSWPFIANRGFMLRWDSGTTAPLESSYERMLVALIEGLER